MNERTRKTITKARISCGKRTISIPCAVPGVQEPGFECVIVDNVLPDGWGVGRHHGMTIFVPGAVVGDHARVVVRRRAKKFAYAELISLAVPSPLRQSAACLEFGVCSGCILQDLSYDAQLELKQRFVTRTLRNFHAIAPGEYIPIIRGASGSCRNKITLTCTIYQGTLRLGMHARVSPLRPHVPRVVPVEQCSVFGVRARQIIAAFEQCIAPYTAELFSGTSGACIITEIVIRQSSYSGDCMVAIGTQGIWPRAHDVARALCGREPVVASCWVMVNAAGAQLAMQHAAGKYFLEERLGACRYHVYPVSFFQPHSELAQRLYEMIAEYLISRSARVVLGAYCGMGSIEIYIARCVQQVYGIDCEPANIANARENAAINNIANCIFFEGTIEQVLARQHVLRMCDAVIVDPPRAGISAEGMSHIRGLGAHTLVYVSCNPASLARDAAILADMGWQAQRFVCFDFFPHTGHVETLGLFEKKV